MSAKHFYVVVYDISNDRRRVRLHKRLQDYGSPVQFSVFECLLEEERHQAMLKMIRRTIKPTKDQVRIYFLCESCLQKVWTSAASREVLHETSCIVV